MYEADWEAEHAQLRRELRLLVAEPHGLSIAFPEHNGGYTALLKNSIDWISPPEEYEKREGSVLLGKLAAVMSA
ncbi:NAD(P)H-dependent oxidoreductase [Bradyrhizobium sp. LVM 105]|uniref:NAD(P)H-dependent oxidoreductase n=1 Tax=Bradyrhizobium sp. LVM 105 TaxID=2341115 RepID=UPI000F7FF68D|nr:NAD(P)H-dependent oxidoreductase [Bradyrhizobium sp. LVM 105]RTE91339.1 hypothetical protein D6B98_22070 [Bradyrhizobium sp. LVM 105]